MNYTSQIEWNSLNFLIQLIFDVPIPLFNGIFRRLLVVSRLLVLIINEVADATLVTLDFILELLDFSLVVELVGLERFMARMRWRKAIGKYRERDA